MSTEVGPISPARLAQLLGLMGVRTGTAVYSGAMVVPVPGVALPIAPISIPAMSVTIKANRTNTNYIYVGGALTATAILGFRLSPGETVSLDIDDANKVYIDAVVAGEGVTYIGVV